MLNDIQLARYHHLRSQGVNATNAHKAASRWRGLPSFDFDPVQHTVSFRHGVFDVLVAVSSNLRPDLSYVGTFDDDWDLGAIELRDAVPARYFHPAVTETEAAWGLSKRGYSRHQAAELAAEYVKADLDAALGHTPHYDVDVQISLIGMNLSVKLMRDVIFDGQACTPELLVEFVIVDGLVDEAIATARKTLRKVTDTVGEGFLR